MYFERFRKMNDKGENEKVKVFFIKQDGEFFFEYLFSFGKKIIPEMVCMYCFLCKYIFINLYEYIFIKYIKKKKL
jgi:hypothetical protein